MLLPVKIVIKVRDKMDTSAMKKNSGSSSTTRENISLMIATVILGVIVGFSAICLSLLLEFVEKIFLNYLETAQSPVPTAGPLHRLLSVTVGGLLVAIVWYFLRNKTQPTVGIKKALDGQKMPVLQTIVHVCTQIVYVGTGGSIGRELAPREAGAMLAQTWIRFQSHLGLADLTDDDRRLLIAAAAGAGFAGIYIAPITGMLFCVEILLKKLSLRNVLVSLTMSMIAMLMGSLIKGFHPYYLVGDAHFSMISLILVIIIAPFTGFAGALFRVICQWAEKNQVKKSPILWQLPLVAFLTGVVAYFFPEIMGNGRALAQTAMWTKTSQLLWLLIAVGILKAVVTVLTIRFGAAGGTLTPAIAIGAAMGAIIGIGLSQIWPNLVIWQCAVLGAVTLLSASQQAPFMAMFMILEICHLNYSVFWPMAIGVAIAMVISRQTLKKYNTKVQFKTVPVPK